MIADESAIAKDAACTRCSSWVHCCGNCSHYDEYSREQCREKRAAFISDRLGRNQCAFFKMRAPARMEENKRKEKLSPRAAEVERSNRAKEGLNNLFR
jgi:hypothetical protein